jgi:hypothetical protein
MSAARGINLSANDANNLLATIVEIVPCQAIEKNAMTNFRLARAAAILLLIATPAGSTTLGARAGG